MAVAAVVLVALAVVGAGVNDKLGGTSLSAPGTESSRGNDMLREYFGPSAPFAILLRGPGPELDRQGPGLVEALRREPKLTAVSPWDLGTGMEHLRPSSRSAVVLVDFHVSMDTAMATIVPRLDRVIDRIVAPPVSGRAAGLATVAKAIRDESNRTTKRGELILAPILLVILLFVFRSPVAAAIPLIFGAATVIAARGLISIEAGFVDISSFALSIGTMIGLGLGVDYALLTVSRFREELKRGADPAEAASVMRMTAGRTITFAGSILLMAVLLAVLLVPGALLLSLCATVAPVILVAVAGPAIVGPAVFVLLGENVNRWPIGRRGPAGTRWLAMSRVALRNPRLTVASISALVLLLVVPAAFLSTGPVTIEELPGSNSARLDVEAIEAAVGGGWISPSVVVAVNEDGPVTERRQLASLNRWQAKIARQPGVEAVIGPGTLVKRVAPLQRVSHRFLDERSSSGDSITGNLDNASTGLARLRRGLGAASEGARTLAMGSGRAQAGATLLADGLSLATSGGSRARDALDRFRRGAHLLAGGERSTSLAVSLLDFSVDELRDEVAGQTLPGAKRLRKGLSRGASGLQVAESAATTTVEKLEAAWRELGSMDPSDPHYAPLSTAVREALTAASGRDPDSGARYVPGYDGLPAALVGIRESLRRSDDEAGQLQSRLTSVLDSIDFLSKLANRLQIGVDRLEGGSQRLAGGSDHIVNGAERLRSGLTRLAGGAERLAGGMSRLQDGNARLDRGLSKAFRKTLPLVTGARQAEARVTSVRDRLRRTSPGLFDSGYFVLSALDGAPEQPRELAGQAVSLASGGQAAKILVVDSEGSSGDSSVVARNDRLREEARGLATRTGLQVAVTGNVAQSIDYQRATGARLLPLVLAITFLTFLVMLMILRALPLAAVAIVLNLLSVAAAFGVLELLTLLPEELPFGGTHHIDPVGAAGIFGVVFGLSIDYAVFLLMRMREGWERDGDNDAAVAYGLERTASVITGAATIMVFVFMVFATAPIQTVSQFGISLTVAVALDATVIRLMLVPALMKLAGPRIWWFPAWLERHLPRLNVDGNEVAV